MRETPILLSLFLIVSGCSGDTTAPSNGGAAGGSGGGSSSGGSGGGSGSGGTSAQGGSGGNTAGGSGGSGGDVAGASGGTNDEDASIDGETPDVDVIGAADGNLDTGTRPGDAGRYWLSPCQAGWTRDQCCTHYCGCMATNCAAQLPADCQNACVTAQTWKLDCRVEQCFESLNPNVPQDAVSHCKHAIEKPTKCQNLQP
jgi:hypothetical protein